MDITDIHGIQILSSQLNGKFNENAYKVQKLMHIFIGNINM